MKFTVKTSSRNDKLLRKILIEYFYNDTIRHENSDAPMMFFHKRSILLRHLYNTTADIDESILHMVKQRGFYDEV
jgi:hypothetical protein